MRQMARDEAPIRPRLERRRDVRAHRDRDRAARMECATARARGGVRRFTGKQGALPSSARVRNGRQQRLRVGVRGLGVHRVGIAALDDQAEIHDGDLVRKKTHELEVVADEQHGQPELRLQIAQKVRHLRLDRHVERGHRLIADQYIGFGRQRPCKHGALPLPARQLLGITCGLVRSHTDGAQQLDRALSTFLASADPMHGQRLGNLHADGLAPV